MKLHSLFLIALLAAPSLRAEDEKPPTEVAVQVTKVIKADLKRGVTAYGVIEPEPNSAGRPPASAKLASAMAGIITEISGVEGQHVKKGDVLFKLDSRIVDAAVLKGEEAVAFAKKNSERQRKLIGLEGTSEKLVLEAEQALNVAQTDLATAKVHQSLLRGEAPLDGTLVHFTARLGEPADIVAPLAEIVDMERLIAAVRVPSAEAASLKLGQKAGVNGIEGVISFISPQVDPLSDTVLVRLSLPKGSGMKPGSFVTARIIIEERPGRLAVPRESVYTDYDGVSTLSVVEGDTAKKKTVKAGLRDGNLVEVEGEGLNEGTTVVTLGSYALPEVTKVRILESAAKEDAK